MKSLDHDPEAFLGTMVAIRLRHDIACRALVELKSLLENPRNDSEWMIELFGTLDLIAIQLRKSLEGYALAGIAANRGRYQDVREKWRSDRKIGEVLKTLNRVNPNGYPRAVLEFSDVESRKVINAQTPEIMNSKKMLKMWGELSDLLHEVNPYSFTEISRGSDRLHEIAAYIGMNFFNFSMLIEPNVLIYRVTMKRVGDHKVVVDECWKQPDGDWINRMQHESS